VIPGYPLALLFGGLLFLDLFRRAGDESEPTAALPAEQGSEEK
jgi:hypothetical protein